MMANNDASSSLHFSSLVIDAQADLVEKHKVDTLLYCPNSWALRHVFINQDTGEVVRARCNRWDCLFCGPRKVDVWRQLVKAAEKPTLFLAYIVNIEADMPTIGYIKQYLGRGKRLACLISVFTTCAIARLPCSLL
jgi:hypothetical protein